MRSGDARHEPARRDPRRLSTHGAGPRWEAEEDNEQWESPLGPAP